MDPVAHIVEAWLLQDQTEPRKQRHTARRIYKRLVREHGFTGGESTVRRWIREWRQCRREVYLPLSFRPGEAAQVDWGEAQVIWGGQRVTVQLFIFRLCYSRMPFVIAFRHQRQEAFFEGHRCALETLGGVTRRAIYDNTKITVKKILEGYNQEENPAFLAFRTHYLLEADYCTPHRAHEKGLVENLVGFARRNFLVPVPEVNSEEELNELLWEGCLTYAKEHKIGPKTIWELWAEEQRHLRRLPERPFECCQYKEVVSNSYSLVRFETNGYSVPSAYAYRPLLLKAFVDRVAVYRGTQLVAEHPRLYGKNQESIRLEHYVDVLYAKPRGIYNARPAQQLPPVFLRYLDGLKKVHQKAEKILVRILLLVKSFGLDTLTVAVELALDRDIYSFEGVLSLAREVDSPCLGASARLLPEVRVQPVDLSRYNQLLAGGVGR
jgi:transposase